MYDFYLVMSCFGLRIDDFVDCAGVENIILKCHSGLANYPEMMNYFDTCRLFDRPMLEFNSIRHFIFNLQDKFDQIDKPLWTQKKFDLYQKFVIDHRHCGLLVKLVLPEEKPIQEDIKDQQISIKSSQNKLRLILGKK